MRTSARPWLAALSAVSFLTLGSCAGGSNLPPSSLAPGGVPSTAVQQAAPDAFPPDALSPELLKSVVIEPGGVYGRPDLFHPKAGDARGGGRGESVDGVPCDPVMVTDEYHVHFFLGILDHGHAVAIPTTIGMKDPGAAVDGFTNDASCYYYIHTHDSSGMIHVEYPRMLPYGDVVYKMKTLLDIWGIARRPNRGFGPFVGPVRIYVGNVPLKQTLVAHYALTRKSLDDIPIRSHEVVWLEIGPGFVPPSRLPSVTFYTEY